jgi:hypothetical protein
MRKTILLTILALALLIPSMAFAEGENGCAPEYQAVTDSAVVKLQGTGDIDITVVTDPLCWHCRLGHKLLGEEKKLYRTLSMVFFPRKQFIGSDMAAWILEDAAGTDSLQAKVDFAYKHLKQPKTEDLGEARDIVLTQFLFQFPQMIGENETVDELSARLENNNAPHVSKTAELCRTAEIPGTPILIAGEYVLLGYGAGPWVKALKAKRFCK